MSKCRYCSTDPENDSLDEAIESLLSCNNCGVDLDCKGSWTGDGLWAMQELVRIHGKDAVLKALKRKE